MTFSELATYFEKLESTSSRLLLIDILAELLQKTSNENIDSVVYLIQGRIAPFFAPIEIGMADKNVAQALALAYETTKEEVTKSYNKLGDMGLAARELAQKAKRKSQPVSINEVCRILLEIAQTSGEGSVEKKQKLLSELLHKLDPISVKHLVRIPLGNMRLGIGDPTVLDAMAKAKFGDRLNKSILETAYNRTSDLGFIGKVLWEKDINAVAKLTIQVGKPIRSELCERLPNPEKVIEKMGIVDVQYKYDGFRVQIHKDGDVISMFSRNLENMTHMFPELIQAARMQVKAKTVILDTEALAYNPASDEFLSFQETTKRRRKHNIEEMAKKLPLRAFVFDILYKNGESLIEKPLTERLKILGDTIEKDDILIATKNQKISDPKELSIILEDAISKGLEGVVVKRLESQYEAGGRNFNWVKLKRHSNGELHDTIDTVILGYITGKGKRIDFGAGALLVGVYDKEKDEFVTVSKIGTGLTDEEWKEVHKRADRIKVDHKPARVRAIIEPSVWIKPQIVIEVLADEITRSPIHTAGASINPTTGEKEPGYALRFPRLVSFRDNDKRPEDATTTDELYEMYKQQGIKS